MRSSRRYSSRAAAIFVLCTTLLLWNDASSQPNIRTARQGYSMRLSFNNKGVLGRDAIPDSVGLEYPIGSLHEHIYGAGLWIGGILDTSSGPTPAYVRGTSTTYEGWAGPLYEFYPGSSPADTIWKVTGRGIPRPPGWDGYWGNAIPQISFSDNDHYCVYDDNHVQVIAHTPLRLKVVQSSFVWSDPYAEAIHIMEYKIINTGVRQIDSTYVGMFLDADVGPNVPNYYQRNYTGYYSDVRTAYIHNPVDPGSTPVGITILHSSLPLDSLRWAFRWWPGPQHPNTDAGKYTFLSSGIIQHDEFPALSDTRCLLSIGPFILHPPGNPLHDTLVVAIGIVSGQDLVALQLHARRARLIYMNGGAVSVHPPQNQGPDRFALYQNYPNPFNPATTIRFALAKQGFVSLTIFNMLGEEVARLVGDEMAAGLHSVVWDAAGSASGVYICTLRAGEYVESRKLVLLR